MLVPNNKVQRAFDRAAHTYENQASIQLRAGIKLLSGLPTHAYSSAFDLGCGVGSVTEKLLATHRIKHLLAADISSSSLQLARTRLANHNITFSVLDFNRELPDTPCDLIFANMSLQWSHDFFTLLRKLYHLLSQHGVLAFSVPLDGTFAELSGLFSLNHFFTATDITDFLSTLDAHLVFSDIDSLSLDFADTHAALCYIKQLGASHVSQRLRKGLSGKKRLAHTHISTLTYQIGYFSLRKPA